jgi:hypothetical protein
MLPHKKIESLIVNFAGFKSCDSAITEVVELQRLGLTTNFTRIGISTMDRMMLWCAQSV